MDHPVRIAVLDSGINPRHPHLRDVEIDGFDVVSRGDRVWLESGFGDRNGHGTAVAAAIAGHEIHGSLLAFRVLDHRLRSDYRCLAFAVVEAARRGAWLINLSLGTRSAAGGRHLAQAAAAALQTGATLIAAAPPSGRGWPSDLDEVISAVADPTCPPGRCRRIEVEGKAPDGETRQLLRFGAHGMAVPPAERGWSGNLAGNSLASAHLTGLAARILAEEPGLDPGRLAEALEARYGIEG
ncbi:MAG: S8 family serine peptidase [Myxococcota bacterium]|jgi:subtilisin family serine protease|nr:S8 family serine peptidase [Myxococcota bacterium]